MKEINQSLLAAQFENEIEKELQEVIEVFQNLSESALLQPSSTNGWSIAQCFEHLNSYFDFYLPRLKKALEKADTLESTPNFKFTWIGNYFIKMMDPERSKKKYKAIALHQPQASLTDPYQAISTFIQHLEDLLLR